jgi:hypothetical protein
MRYFELKSDAIRRRAAEACMTEPEGSIVKISGQTRNLEQNALLWPLLQEVSRQVIWYGQKLSDEDWKDIFSASLKRSKVVPGLEAGSFVVCGQSTSNMSKRDFSELLELIFAFGAEHNVKFKEAG